MVFKYWPTNHLYLNKDNPLCEMKFSTIKRALEYGEFLHKQNPDYYSISLCKEKGKIIYVAFDEETWKKLMDKKFDKMIKEIEE